MIIFPNSQIRQEFGLLHPDLLKILYWLSGWVELNTNAGAITLTHLIRTQSEQDEIYGADPEYQLKPWKSVHQFGRGADISLSDFIFERDNVEAIIATINSNWRYRTPGKQTALIHQVGNMGMHMHIQV